MSAVAEVPAVDSTSRVLGASNVALSTALTVQESINSAINLTAVQTNGVSNRLQTKTSEALLYAQQASNFSTTRLSQAQQFAQTMYNQALGLYNKMKAIKTMAMIIVIGKCFFQFLKLTYESLIWVVYFSKWMVLSFIPFLYAFTICAIQGLVNLPQCTMWYMLDIAGRIAYLPFRFIFWLLDQFLNIGLQNIEHDIWCFFDSIDRYVHDPPNYGNPANYDVPPDMDPSAGLGTGYHIIHFPDEVMQKCYHCKWDWFETPPKYPIELLLSFMECVTNPFSWGEGGF